MVVKEVDFLGMYKEKNKVFLDFSLKVSSGTYVRSLVEEVGKSLGVPATLYALRRNFIGDISVNEAFSFKDLENKRSSE